MSKQLLFASFSVAVLSLTSCSETVIDVPTDFKAIEYTDIKGSHKLGQPYFLRDDKGNPFFVEKYGNAYPAIFDFNRDGKEDLLIGEFGGGKSANLLAFSNIGENKKPVFSSEGNYLTDINNDNLYILGN